MMMKPFALIEDDRATMHVRYDGDVTVCVRPRRHRQVILSLILWLANRQPSTPLAEG